MCAVRSPLAQEPSRRRAVGAIHSRGGSSDELAQMTGRSPRPYGVDPVTADRQEPSRGDLRRAADPEQIRSEFPLFDAVFPLIWYGETRYVPTARTADRAVLVELT